MLTCLTYYTGDAGSTWSSGRQMSIREWDIPYEELKIGDKVGRSSQQSRPVCASAMLV